MNIKPTAIKEASGAYKKNPSRRKKGEPQPLRGIGKAAESRNVEYSAVWDELVNDIPPGVLFCSDRVWLEIAVTLLCEFRQMGSEFSGAKLNQLQKALSHLGMSPVDRTRIVAEQAEESSKEDEYF